VGSKKFPAFAYESSTQQGSILASNASD